MYKYRLNNNIFREYDIRGIVEEDFPEDFIYDLGMAIGTKFLTLGEKQIAVSGDLRETTNFIKSKLIKGLINTGMNGGILKIHMVNLLTSVIWIMVN